LSRWVSTSAACRIWGGGICIRTMQRLVERWHDTGYSIGRTELTPGGHWRIREDFLRSEREKSTAERKRDNRDTSSGGSSV
jgi:hypothetical protein